MPDRPPIPDPLNLFSQDDQDWLERKRKEQKQKECAMYMDGFQETWEKKISALVNELKRDLKNNPKGIGLPSDIDREIENLEEYMQTGLTEFIEDYKWSCHHVPKVWQNVKTDIGP